MNFKLLENCFGKNGEEAYKKIVNEETPITPKGIIPPSSELSFITDNGLHQEICKYIQSEFPRLRNPLEFKNGVMTGSNPFAVVAIDMFLRKDHQEYRIARQVDLETKLQMFNGFYVDSGLALRNLTGTNREKALYLFEQLRRRGVSENDLPIWIDLRGLRLTPDLNFELTDKSRYKLKANCLNWKNRTPFSKVDDKFGLPIEPDPDSSRKIWTSEDNSLSRCYLNWNSYLSSSDSDCAYSDVSGRVVVAKVRST